MGEISEKEGMTANGQVPGEAEKRAAASVYQESLPDLLGDPRALSGKPFDIFLMIDQG